jgi:hypothetical protein
MQVTQFIPQLTSNAANQAAVGSMPWQVHLVGYLAWPLAALAIALIFWRPLSAFIASIGGRVTKLSLLSVGVELTPATSATETLLLNDVRDASAAHINNSSAMELDQVQMGTPADFAVLDIGQGQEWLTSRLYIADIMLSRMRGVKVFVFVETVGSARRRFIAVAPLAELRWSLARKYPWLEAAWNRALQEVFPAGDPKTISADAQGMIQSDDGAFKPWPARQITSAFIQQVQDPARAAKRKTADWVKFDDGRAERAAWVTYELLLSLLPSTALQAWAPAMPDAPRARRTRAVLRRNGDFTALVHDDRSFLRLVNRRAVLEEVATVIGEETDDRAPKAA